MMRANTIVISPGPTISHPFSKNVGIFYFYSVCHQFAIFFPVFSEIKYASTNHRPLAYYKYVVGKARWIFGVQQM